MIVNSGSFGRELGVYLDSIGYRVKHIFLKGDSRVLLRSNVLDSSVTLRGEIVAKNMAKANLTQFLLNVARYYAEVTDFVYDPDFFLVSAAVLQRLLLTVQNAYKRCGPSPFVRTGTSCFDEFEIEKTDVLDIFVRQSEVSVSDVVVDYPLEIKTNASLVVFCPPIFAPIVEESSYQFGSSGGVMCNYLGGPELVVSIECLPNDRVVVSLPPNMRNLSDTRTDPPVRVLLCDGLECYRDNYGILYGSLFNFNLTNKWREIFQSNFLVVEESAGKSTCCKLIRDYGVLVLEDSELMKSIDSVRSPTMQYGKWRRDIAKSFAEIVMRAVLANVPVIWSVSNYEWFIERYPGLKTISVCILDVGSVHRDPRRGDDVDQRIRDRDRSKLDKLIINGIRSVKGIDLPHLFFSLRQLNEIINLKMILYDNLTDYSVGD